MLRIGNQIRFPTFGGDLKWHANVRLLVTEGELSLDGQLWVRPYNLGWLISEAGVKKMWRYHYSGAALLDPGATVRYLRRYTKRAVLD